MQNISIIVAIDQQNGIGKNNQLLCYLPNDLKHFKQITSGRTVIMGRKTYESLPNGALPNRRNIVISRNSSLDLPSCEMALSLSDALLLCKKETEVYIIGGASIYKQAFPLAQTLYVTQIEDAFEADTFFPNIETSEWRKIEDEKHAQDEKHCARYSFEKWERKTVKTSK